MSDQRNSAGADARQDGPRLVEVWHAFKRLQAGIADKPAFIARARSILERHGNSAPNCSNLDRKCYAATLIAAREALAIDLAAFAPIFPLQPDSKIPYAKKNKKGPGGHLLATRDLKQIRAWIRECPNCNWGLRGGDDASPLDIDTKDPLPGKRRGTETWEALVSEHGEPETRTAQTPSGGLHVFVKGNLSTGTGTLGDGIDTRGSGGYVVAAGSHVVANNKDIRVTGFYRWLNNKPVAEIPWINKRAGHAVNHAERGQHVEIELDQDANAASAIGLLKGFASSPREEDSKGRQKNGPAIQGEGGDDWTFRVACMVGDLGISREMCHDLMFEHFNPACVPPWKGDDEEGDARDRLSTKVNSAYNSRQTPPGSGTAEADFANDPLPAPEPEPSKRNRFRGRSLSELDQLKDPTWILPGMIPEGFTVVYGKPKRGKSFWAIELSIAVAADYPFHGTRLGKAGRVLYIAAEGGAAQVRNRVRAVLSKRGIVADKVEDTWRLVDCGTDLNSQKLVDEFLSANPGQWTLIVIDTLARNMTGDENSTEEMNKVIGGCDYIRAKTGAAVILVHHEGWANARPRGAITLFAALDALIHVFRKDSLTIVEAEELRDAAPGAASYFRLADGVLEPMPTKGSGVDKLREREQKMLKVLTELCAKGVAISLKQWRAAVDTAGLLEGTRKTKEKTWLRARRQLEKTSCIKINGANVIPWDGGAADDFSD